MSNDKEKESSSPFRLVFELIGFALLAYLAFQVGREIWKDDYSYGPDAIGDQEFIIAPGISVELLPSADTLATTHFKHFDISKEGAVLVSAGKQLFDMLKGEVLFSAPVDVHSFAFAGDALAITTEQGELGFYDDGKFSRVSSLQTPATGLMASSDRSRLFLYRENYDDSGESPAIISLRAGEKAVNLTGSFTPIKTVSGDAFQTYYADANAIYQVVAKGQPSLVMVLPDKTQAILGLASAGNALYFSTEKAVYLLDNDIALPLVIGIGGELRMSGADVYVLDSKNGRVYRVAVKTEEAKP